MHCALGAQALKHAYYGEGSGPIFMDDVGCAGNESTLISCPHLSNHDCYHNEDAGVYCITSTGDLLLFEE